MNTQKKQMQEAAVLYYEKKFTQSEIAKQMKLSRQTVSKLLNDAVKENIVEIKINDPKITCKEYEEALCEKFNLKKVIVCGVSTADDSLCKLMTARAAGEYILSIVKSGNKKIALSWGRTVEALISELPSVNTSGNTVFPLFGATDIEEPCFSSNELARSFADKIDAKVKNAWFPYRPDSASDCELFKKTSYYESLKGLWNNIDVAVVGIGNNAIIQTFGKIFGYSEKCASAVGDISTHFFDQEGNVLDIYENTLCADMENIKNAKETIAVACGKHKAQAIIGALRTQMIDTLITDEYTAKNILHVMNKQKVEL